MGKTVRLIASVAAAAVVFAVTANPQLAFAAFAITNAVTTAAFGPKAPPPATTEAALKTPRPERVSAYGRRRLFGAYSLYETTSATRSVSILGGTLTIGGGSAVDVFAVHDGRADGVETIYLGDDKVTLSGNTVQQGTDKRYKGGAVSVYWTLGEVVGTAIAAVVAALPGVWTNAHRGDGVVALATIWKSVKEKDFSETYPQGGPVAASMVARWQRVFDWRDGAQAVDDPSTWKWSENAALHLAHYKLVREKAYRAPGEAMPSALALSDAWALFFAPTLASWTAAANVCDEAVPLAGGGTEPRYRSCVAHKHTDPHKAVTGALVACFDGWIAPRSDGALVVYAGRYYEPTVTVGPDAIVAYSWKSGVDDEDAINEVPITFVSADHDFNTVDGVAWLDEADLAERWQVRSEPLDNQVPSGTQARRLAKRKAMQSMAPFGGTVTTNYQGRAVRGQRFINLHLEEAGSVFYSGPAEIVALTRNLETGGVTFTWIAADPAIDDWSPADEEGATTVPGAREPTAALAAVVITAPVLENGGLSGARLTINADSPDPERDDLTWVVRWRPEGETVWNEQVFTDVPAGPSVTLAVGLVPLDANIETEVTYMTGDGRSAEYSAAEVAPMVPSAEILRFDGGNANGELEV